MRGVGCACLHLQGGHALCLLAREGKSNVRNAPIQARTGLPTPAITYISCHMHARSFVHGLLETSLCLISPASTWGQIPHLPRPLAPGSEAMRAGHSVIRMQAGRSGQLQPSPSARRACSFPLCLQARPATCCHHTHHSAARVGSTKPGSYLPLTKHLAPMPAPWLCITHRGRAMKMGAPGLMRPMSALDFHPPICGR